MVAYRPQTFWEQIKDIPAIFKDRNLLITDVRDGIAKGLYLEKLRSHFRIWDYYCPFALMEAKVYFSYSRILFEAPELGEEEVRILRRHSRRQGAQLRHDAWLYMRSNADEPFLQARLDLALGILLGNNDAIKASSRFILDHSSDCDFPWWKDALSLNNIYEGNPQKAKALLREREELAYERLNQLGSEIDEATQL